MKYFLSIAIFCISLQINASELITILPHNELIQYWGRNVKSAKKVSFSYSGAGLEFMLVGKSATIKLNDEGNGDDQHTNYLSVEINGVLDSVLELNGQRKQYDLTSLLIKDTNSVRIIKRTETAVGAVSFYGITIEKDAQLLAPERRKKKILWIGDSFMCGYGNQLNILPPPHGNPNTGFHSINENNYLSWSSIVSRAFNAEDQQVCYSGKGIFRNIDDSKTETIPLIFEQAIPNEFYHGNWIHRSFIPDVVIVALGTNDFGPEMTDNNNLLDSSDFVTTYINFINKLHTTYTKSKIVLIVGNALTDYWPTGLQRLTRSRNYLKASKQHSLLPHLVSIFELASQRAPYGEDWHATTATHQTMSKELTPYLMELMDWEIYLR